MSHKHTGNFQRMDLPAKKAKSVPYMDNLTMDALAAQSAGMSYGKYKALHPETQAQNDAMREQVLQDLKNQQQEKADQPPRSRSRTGDPLTYKKTCPMCGQKFETPNTTRLYCSRDCKRKMSRMREAAKKEARHGQ